MEIHTEEETFNPYAYCLAILAVAILGAAAILIPCWLIDPGVRAPMPTPAPTRSLVSRVLRPVMYGVRIAPRT